MKNSSHEKFLKECIGETGYEALNKAIMRQGMDTPTELNNTYTSLLVVPRALLAWVAATLRPMAEGGVLEVGIPGSNGARMNVNKFKNDIYSGEIHRDGKIVHRFTDTTIPLLAGHLMTVLELYDDFEEKPKNSEAVVNGLVPLIEQMVAEHMKTTQPTINLTINNISQPKEEARAFVPPTLPVIKEEPKSDSFAVGYHMALGNYHRGKGNKDKAFEHDKRMDSHIKKVGGQFAKINKEEFDAGAAKATSNIQKDEWSDDAELEDKQNVYEEEHEKLVDEKEKEDAEDAKDKERSGSEEEAEKHEAQVSIDIEKSSDEDSDDKRWEKVHPGKHLVGVDPKEHPKPTYDETKGQWVSNKGKTKTIMSKAEMESVCPDCGDPEFKDGQFVGCMCMYEMRKAEVKVVKNTKGHYELEFGKGWDEENIQLLLDMLRRRE